MSKTYFELKYRGPWKGVNTELPEDLIPPEMSPFALNYILKSGEIRTRPQQAIFLPGTPDENPILFFVSFQDANNVYHSCAGTSSGLWQLNRSWNRNNSKATWSQIGQFPVQPGPNFPASVQVFVNKLFWTNGGTNLWMWDGITSVGAPSLWKKNTAYKQGDQIVDSNGKVEVANNGGVSSSTVPVWNVSLAGTAIDNVGTGQSTIPITWVQGGVPAAANGFNAVGMVDVTRGVTAGAYFLIELNSQLIMLNTIESAGGNFPQRIRWTPSGFPTIWDPNVNVGAGFNDELDVSDSIFGAMTVGTTAFILRHNGITEMTSTGQGINPWNFNHLWASEKGIGNIFPFGFASYGPLGIFISSDDIYNVSLGGFKRIGGNAKDSIYNDLFSTTGFPIGNIIPFYQGNYVYNHYKLAIPISGGTKIWNYSIEDDSWISEFKSNIIFSGKTRYVFTK